MNEELGALLVIALLVFYARFYLPQRRKGAEGIEDGIMWLVAFLCVFCVLIVNN